MAVVAGWKKVVISSRSAPTIPARWPVSRGRGARRTDGRRPASPRRWRAWPPPRTRHRVSGFWDRSAARHRPAIRSAHRGRTRGYRLSCLLANSCTHAPGRHTRFRRRGAPEHRHHGPSRGLISKSQQHATASVVEAQTCTRVAEVRQFGEARRRHSRHILSFRSGHRIRLSSVLSHRRSSVLPDTGVPPSRWPTGCQPQ